MTTNDPVATVRAALAAADPSTNTETDWRKNDAVLAANAPTWLASLCDEVEALRGENALGEADWIQARAERDAALTENERLRGERQAQT